MNSSIIEGIFFSKVIPWISEDSSLQASTAENPGEFHYCNAEEDLNYRLKKQ
jgi:hypothetical protein